MKMTSNPKANPKILSVLGLCVVMLSACSGLLDSRDPAPKTWWLEPLSGNSAETSQSTIPLALDLDAIPGLDTNKILTLDGSSQLNFFSGSQWPDHLPETLGSLLSRSLQNSGRFYPVVLRSNQADGGCLLNLETRRFYARLGSDLKAHSVEVSLAGNFKCPGLEKAIRVEATVPVSGNDIPEIVSAFQEALDEATRKLIEQLDGQ